MLTTFDLPSYSGFLPILFLSLRVKVQSRLTSLLSELRISTVFKQVRRHMAQDHLLIWFDPTLDETSHAYQDALQQLRSVVDHIVTFINADEFVDFLTDQQDTTVLLVMDDTIARRLLSLLHGIPQLKHIYILRHEDPSSTELNKAMSMHSDIPSLCAALSLRTQQRRQDSISTSILSVGQMRSNGNLNELEPSFMYTRIFKDILLNMHDEQRSFHDFIKYCRTHGFGSATNIDRFAREYHDRSPVWWYTWTAFLYEMLNHALRTLQADTIIKMGFVIRDLHHAIQHLDEEQRPSYEGKPFRVYRGQGLSTDAFHRLTRAKGGLISFNNFLSTSRLQEVSHDFAMCASTAADTVGVLFVMTIDPAVSSTPFACIEHLSAIRMEAEILFSMHAVFRIGDVKKMDDGSEIYEVELVLTADDDEELRTLTKWFAADVEDDVGWKRLGSMLMKIGQREKAEELFKAVLEETTDAREKLYYYYQLAFIKHKQDDARMVGWYVLKTTELEKSMSTACTNGIGVIRIHTDENNKGLLFYRASRPTDPVKMITESDSVIERTEDCEADEDQLAFHEKSLEYFEQTLAVNHDHRATVSDHIDPVNDDLKLSSPSLWFQRKILEIRQKHLPPDHPDIARSYAVLASLYASEPDYLQALLFYEKSVELHQQILPSNHPILACLYHNISVLHTDIKEWSTALLFAKKAVAIAERVLPPDHRDLGAAYHNLAETYDDMDDPDKAVFYAKKELAVYANSPHVNHSYAESSYRRIGKEFCKTNQYSEALPFFEKALEARQRNLPFNEQGLADDYAQLGSLHRKTGDDENALCCYNKSIDIIENHLPVNGQRLTSCYDQIARIYEAKSDYDQALSFYEKALESSRSTGSSGYMAQAGCHNNIAGVYFKMEEYTKARSQFQQALFVMQDKVPADDPHLISVQENIAYVNKTGSGRIDFHACNEG